VSIAFARRKYIDWARALAILIMIEAHTLDAWTRVSERTSHAFRDLTILGGFAAPLFLWLAGIGVALSAERRVARGASRAEAASGVCRRGLEIFVLAFLFRLQAFVVSPGSHPVMLFRVDILNVMGPAIGAAAMLWGVTRGGPAMRGLVMGAAATCVAMSTPIIRTAAWVDTLPTWFQWYVRPAGEYTTFTMFPWSGFVFAGASAGSLIAAARTIDGERRLQIGLSVAGAALIAIGFSTAALPPLFPQATFWNTSPTFFAIRIGIMTVALAALFALERLLERVHVALPAVERLGRSSLFVYWIHVELVYGYASWLWRGRLALWQLGLGYTVFVVLCYGAILLRDRVVAMWAARRSAEQSAASAVA
jgi:uncharacterized membrane protein